MINIRGMHRIIIKRTIIFRMIECERYAKKHIKERKRISVQISFPHKYLRNLIN